MREEMGLEGGGDGGLEFLDTLVCAAPAITVDLAEGGDVELGFDVGVGGVTLASSGVGVIMGGGSEGILRRTVGLEEFYPSLGPVTVQTTIVLPIVKRLLPSLEGWVEIEAVIRRSSFHLRPS